MLKTSGFQRHMRGTPIVVSMLLATTILCLALWYIHLSISFPYYFAFDMDLVATAESLNINSGKPPHILIHAGYGMYAVHALTHRLASFIGLVSVLTLSELDSALHPIAAIAELTDFFRLHSPLAVLLTVLALWSALVLLFRLPWPYDLGLLIAIGTLDSLAVQALLIRVELYSVCFWSIAILCTVLWLRIKKQEASWGVLFLIGLFLGMSLLTKYQSIFNIAMVFTLMPLLFVVNPPALEYLSRPVSSRQHKIMDGLSIVILFSSIVPFFFALQQPMKAIIGTYNPESPSVVGVAFLAIVGSCTLAHLALRVLRRGDALPLRILFSLDLVLAGAICALLSPLALYSDISTGWELVIRNTQATFCVQAQPVPTSIGDGFVNLAQLVTSRPAAFAVYLVSVLVLLTGILSRAFRVSRMYALPPLFTTAIVTLGAMFAIRPTSRDLIWIDTMFLFPTFVYLGVITRLWQPSKWIPSLLTASVLVVVLWANAIHHPRLRPHIAEALSSYGWAPTQFHGNLFTSPEYKTIIASAYPKESIAIASYRARRYRIDKRIASSVFQNLHVGLDSMSFVEVGRPVWKKDHGWRIQSHSRSLTDCLVVDTSSQTPSNKYFFGEKRTDFKLDRIIEAPEHAGSLSIICRRDLDVFIFLESDDYQRLKGAHRGLVETERSQRPKVITVHDGTRERRLVGLPVKFYAIVPTAEIAHPYFFVIRERKVDGASNPRFPLPRR